MDRQNLKCYNFLGEIVKYRFVSKMQMCKFMSHIQRLETGHGEDKGHSKK